MAIKSIKLERRNVLRASLGRPWRLAQPESVAGSRKKKLDEVKYGRASSSPTGS